MMIRMNSAVWAVDAFERRQRHVSHATMRVPGVVHLLRVALHRGQQRPPQPPTGPQAPRGGPAVRGGQMPGPRAATPPARGGAPGVPVVCCGSRGSGAGGSAKRGEPAWSTAFFRRW